MTVSFLLWSALIALDSSGGNTGFVWAFPHLVPKPRWALIVIHSKSIVVQLAAKPTGADESRAKVKRGRLCEKRPL